MKRVKLFSMMLLVAAVAFTSCKDDESDDPTPGGGLVEDGMYIAGEATPWAEPTANALMVAGINEGDAGAAREGMYEKYVTLEANKEFQIIEVAGSTQTVYGPGEMKDTSLVGVTEHPQVTITYGTFANSGAFTVTNSGMYQVVLDKQLGKVFIVPVNYWGVLGGASDYGWADDATHMTPGNFDKNTMTFSLSNVILRNGGTFKFRHGGGWKVGMEAFDAALDLVRFNTNFGGALDALVPGGADITLEQADGLDGSYTISMTWSADASGYGFTASLTDFSEVEPLPDYVDLFLVGSATAYGWDNPGDNAEAIMHQCANSQDGLYWKILYLIGGEGFKVSAANWGDPNLGFDQVTEFDAEGVTVSSADGNMSVAESGMYVIAADLRTEGEVKISVKPAEVYGIGVCFSDDSWTGTTAFNYDEATKTFSYTTTAPSTETNKLRMYAKVPWNTDWWAAEFNIYDGKIEYRNTGGDQAGVDVQADQLITLHFDDNTGSIE